MITWIVILSIWIILLTACIVGQYFRINAMDETVERLAIALINRELEQDNERSK